MGPVVESPVGPVGPGFAGPVGPPGPTGPLTPTSGPTHVLLDGFIVLTPLNLTIPFSLALPLTVTSVLLIFTSSADAFEPENDNEPSSSTIIFTDGAGSFVKRI